MLSIENVDKRAFYIAEATKNNWTSRQLERQINSQLFERLLMSNDVQKVLAVAREEKLPGEAKEIIKDPMIVTAIASVSLVTFSSSLWRILQHDSFYSLSPASRW